jgi:hypothetical protein
LLASLVVPAGETVFFSEERIVLDSGDEIWVGTSAASRLSVTVSVISSMKFLKTKNISKFSINDRSLIAYPDGNGPGKSSSGKCQRRNNAA